MHIDDLPPELLSQIFQFSLDDLSDQVPDPTLPLYSGRCSLISQVSKRWNEIIAPMLYGSVRLSSHRQVDSFKSTLTQHVEFGSYLRVLRSQGEGIYILREGIDGIVAPNLEELYLSATKNISFERISTFKKLVRLVLWGITLEDVPSAPLKRSSSQNLALPSLRDLSFCGTKNLETISELFTPTSLPSIQHIALAYSPIPNDNFLSRLPVETIVVATSELRRRLLPVAADTTLYTNRFWSVAEGFTNLGELPLRHLHLSDFEGPLISDPFLQLTSQLGPEVKLDTIYLPKTCRMCGDVRQVEEWCEGRKIRLMFEEEIDFMHESLVPRSFVQLCEEAVARKLAEITI